MFLTELPCGSKEEAGRGLAGPGNPVKPVYPLEIRIKRVDFIKMMTEAKRTKDFNRLRDFYTETFKSPGANSIKTFLLVFI